MHLRTRPSLHDMWSRGEHKQPRGQYSHHQVGLKDRLQIRSKHPTAEVQNVETTKAVAWAVFQHHGGGDGRGSSNQGHFHSHCSMGVRRPSRFKIEAQMKQEVAHRSLMPEVLAVRWDAGSTLFDSFELDSLLKTLDQASHPGDYEQDDDDDAEAEAGAVVVYSPNKEIPRTRLLPEDDDDDDDDDDDFVFALQRSAKPAKGVSHHTMWKSLLHSLHLGGAIFHGLQKLQSQVAPHDSNLEQNKGRNYKAIGRHRFGRSSRMDAQHSDGDDVHGRHRQPHLRKFSFREPFQGHTPTKDTGESPLSGPLHEQLRDPRHRWYPHRDEGEDYEMTIQAISRRVPRTSFEEKFRTRRVSMELQDGLAAPRNSLDTDAVDRGAAPKPRSVWDGL